MSYDDGETDWRDAPWSGDWDHDCPLCHEPEEHTDRQAQHLEQDADSAAINAQIEGLA